jgi:hypothetical protein
MDLDDDLTFFVSPRSVYIDQLRHKDSIQSPPSVPSSVSLILSDGALTLPRLEDIIVDFGNDFRLPSEFIDLLFERLSDPSSLSPDLTPRIFTILQTWATTRPSGWSSQLPQDSICILRLWIPAPSALRLLALIIEGSRVHAASFAGELRQAPDEFASFYGTLVRAGQPLPVLELVLALSRYAELLVPLTPFLLDLLEYVPFLRARGLQVCCAILDRCCQDRDCLSSLINSGGLAKIVGILASGPKLLTAGLRLLNHVVCTLGVCEGFRFVRNLAMRHLWIAAIEQLNEVAIEELCCMAGTVCLAGTDAIEVILKPDPPVTDRLLQLHQRVALRTWREIADFASVVIVEGSVERVLDLVQHGAVKAICQVLAATDEQAQDGRFATTAQEALQRIAELVERGEMSPGNAEDREALVDLADAETEEFRPISSFIERIDAVVAERKW